MKNCKGCGKERPLEDYYKIKGNKDGRAGKCKECIKLRVRQNRAENADYYKEYDKKRYQEDPKVRERHKRYQATEAGKASVQKSRKKWLSKNGHKRKAHNLVWGAMRSGKLTRPENCQDCNTSGVAIEAHHENYNRPLDVDWLCRGCHVKRHK